MVLFLLPFAIIVFSSVRADIVKESNISLDEFLFITPQVEKVMKNQFIEDILQKLEHMDIAAEKSRRGSAVDDELYKMTEILANITEQLKDKDNAYKFLNYRGFERLILPAMGINHRPIRKHALNSIKTLFNVAPTTINALTPMSVVKKLLDIFEKDDSPAIKAQALEIMHMWLPNNPKVQVQVMKLKGLEPFYEQILKLDARGIHNLMDLFNKIVEEHKNARSDKSQKNKEDYERMQLYQKIGLLERMSTSQVCNGLLNVLKTMMEFTKHGDLIPPSVLGLAKNMDQFCANKYKGKDKAAAIIEELYKYVVDWHNTDLLINAGLDPTEIRTAVENLYAHVENEDRIEL